ncbi:hypothetical protein [Marinobacter gelidimuriae]|nr:hypothetical protein [Marinobacter gelidimuriae]
MERRQVCRRGRSRIISRLDGGILMLVYVSYTGYLLTTMIPATG